MICWSQTSRWSDIHKILEVHRKALDPAFTRHDAGPNTRPSSTTMPLTLLTCRHSLGSYGHAGCHTIAIYMSFARWTRLWWPDTMGGGALGSSSSVSTSLVVFLNIATVRHHHQRRCCYSSTWHIYYTLKKVGLNPYFVVLVLQTTSFYNLYSPSQPR